MQNRPIAPLVAALKQLGADITYAARENFPPLLIHGKKLKGGSIEIDGSISSQFISALLLIAPTLEGGIQLQLRGEVFSRPYIEMTLKLMHGFGIKSGWSRNTITVQQQKYIPKDFLVEADWSAASYWYEAAALSEEASITLTGLNQNSIQGDSVISELTQQFTVRTEFLPGAIRITKQPSSPPSAFSYNFRACPDLVQAMAVTCAALGTEAALGGVENLRIKETDRLRAMLGELSRLGITAHIASSTFYIPSSHMSGQQGGFAFETYNDHRMAMCLAPLALKLGMVEIKDCEVVKKSYPGFWDDLALAGFEISFL
jgi:3-phosphoshikimate 1-carboxyvinyltransferase